MNIQVYVDESGSKDSNRLLVMVPIVSSVEKWADFSNEWQKHLNEHPKVWGPFKFADALKCKGGFNKFTETERNQKLKSLALIMSRHAEGYTPVGVEFEGFDDTFANLPKDFRSPYFMAFYHSVLGIAFDLWKHGCREKFEIIFDCHVIFEPRVSPWYSLLLEIMKRRGSPILSIMPEAPMFRPDDEFMPLQAADFMAGAHRYLADNGKASEFGWLLNEIGRIRQFSPTLINKEMLKTTYDKIVKEISESVGDK